MGPQGGDTHGFKHIWRKVHSALEKHYNSLMPVSIFWGEEQMANIPNFADHQAQTEIVLRF